MKAIDLRVWHDAMGFNYDTGADALGVHRSTYADLLSGFSRTTGKPKDIDRRTALACAAIAAGLDEWSPGNPQKKPLSTTQGRSTK